MTGTLLNAICYIFHLASRLRFTKILQLRQNYNKFCGQKVKAFDLLTTKSNQRTCEPIYLCGMWPTLSDSRMDTPENSMPLWAQVPNAFCGGAINFHLGVTAHRAVLTCLGARQADGAPIGRAVRNL